MKTKKLVRLRHQFFDIAGELSAGEIAEALSDAGLITLCDDGARYFETEKMRKIPGRDFFGTVKTILSSYRIGLERGRK